MEFPAVLSFSRRWRLPQQRASRRYSRLMLWNFTVRPWKSKPIGFLARLGTKKYKYVGTDTQSNTALGRNLLENRIYGQGRQCRTWGSNWVDRHSAWVDTHAQHRRRRQMKVGREGGRPPPFRKATTRRTANESGSILEWWASSWTVLPADKRIKHVWETGLQYRLLPLREAAAGIVTLWQYLRCLSGPPLTYHFSGNLWVLPRPVISPWSATILGLGRVHALRKQCWGGNGKMHSPIENQVTNLGNEQSVNVSRKISTLMKPNYLPDPGK